MPSRQRRNRASVTEAELAYYRTHIREAIQDHAVICLECGRKYRDLAKHLAQTHGLHADDYREKWGYKRTRGLVCGQRRCDLAAQAKAKGLRGPTIPLQAVRRPAGYRLRQEVREERADAIREGCRRFTHREVTDEDLVRLAAAGLSHQAIAGQFGMSYKTVWERLVRLRARGAPLPAPPRAGQTRGNRQA